MPMPPRVMDDAFSFQRSLEADFFFKLQVQSSVDHDLSLYFTTLNSLLRIWTLKIVAELEEAMIQLTLEEKARHGRRWHELGSRCASMVIKRH